MLGRRKFIQTVGQSALALGVGQGVLSRSIRKLPTDIADPDYWNLVREMYPLTRDRVYFNTGGLGPAPFPVIDIMQRTILAQQEISEHGHSMVEAARAPVAAFFGANLSEVAFMRNATEGNSTVASGLDLRSGDEVIFDAHAHPGGSYGWLNRQLKDGIRVKLFEPDPTSAVGNLERIADLITPKTRVIQISHITAPTGILFPAKEIARLAHEKGIWFHIDGAQSAGMIPVNLHELECDSYATSGHKWMGAPHGTGLLYVREDRLDEVRPTETGSYGDDGKVELPDRFAYNPTAQRYEVGTRDAATVVGMEAAVAFLEEIGIERVAARAQELATYLQQRLRALQGVTVLTPEDPAMYGGITTLRTDKVPHDRLIQYFGQVHNLRCRIVNERNINAVRVSTHIFNNEAECDKVVTATLAAFDEA